MHRLAVIFSEPNSHSFGTVVDPMHERYLVVFFLRVVLIDADGVDPQRLGPRRVPQPPKNGQEVRPYVDGLAVALDGACRLLFGPGVG